MNRHLRSFWSRYFEFDWKFGLFLVMFVCIPRFVLVLNANATGNYAPIGLIMVISALAPFIFLTRYGRKEIGITRPRKIQWLFVAFACGLLASFALYFMGSFLYDSSYHHWYRYIGKSYNIPAGIGAADKRILFAVMALTGMTFSPIGEEFFFRGIVHSGFAKSIGDSRASLVDSAAFALTHISHFGLVYHGGQWDFLFIPTILWVVSMFLIGLLFFTFRKRTGSLLGAILCHAAFNGGMIFCIFYLF